MEPARLLLEGGLLLAAIALSGLLFRALGLSAVPAFMLVGLALHQPVGQSALVNVFATLGVVLLLFFVGLEFSFRALLSDRRRLLGAGTRDLLLNFPAGFLAGWLLGWGVLGGMILATALYVSSSAIIAKSLIDLRRTAYPETELVLGILVFEDVAVALLLAVLSGVVLAGGELIPGMIGAARALVFFAAAIALARLGRPLLEKLLSTEEDDLFMLLMGGALLLMAWAAARLGLSAALGAFLAGTLMAETGHKERIEALFAPLQGLFAALFFLGFGLSIDIREFAGLWPAAVSLALVGIAAKLGTGWWVGRAEGLSQRAAFSLGVTLTPRGEFSIVLAGLAAAAGHREAPALLALLVLILAVVGTAATWNVPRLSRWLSPDARNAIPPTCRPS
ncbi:MAG: cation:proton antiporter [Gemmatimonadetes bacterium]|nr:cation:proton antiporter [Gemmatimonadota bacterium]